jgi:class I fructose-bisphosphate aldolase
MPLLVEVLPGGFSNPQLHTAENTRVACRIAAELGADVIKTKYTGDGKSFSEVVTGCYCPIVVLGGKKMGSDRELLVMVRDAIAAGAAGVVLGRNVWQRSNPRELVSALSRIIHENASLEESMASLSVSA